MSVTLVDSPAGISFSPPLVYGAGIDAFGFNCLLARIVFGGTFLLGYKSSIAAIVSDRHHRIRLQIQTRRSFMYCGLHGHSRFQARIRKPCFVPATTPFGFMLLLAGIGSSFGTTPVGYIPIVAYAASLCTRSWAAFSKCRKRFSLTASFTRLLADTILVRLVNR